VVEPTKKTIKPLASPDTVKQNKVTPIVTPAPTKKEDSNTEATYHFVEEKESMYKISKQYGISVPELLKLNGKTEPTIKVGEKLRVK
jgi:LysM repeat protein